MARLTNTMRCRIIQNLIENGFKKRWEALEEASSIFADTVYHDLYSDEIKAKMAALPKGFLPSSGYIYCKFGTEFSRVYFRKEMIIAARDNRGYAAKVYNSDSLISQRFFRLRDEQDKLKKKEEQAELTAQGILESVNTVEKLLEIWPECRPFVEGVAPVPKPLPPALPIPEINAILGLKPALETPENKAQGGEV